MNNDQQTKLRHSDGSISDFMPLERAYFIRAFTLARERPKIIEKSTCDHCSQYDKCILYKKELNTNSEVCEKYYSQYATRFL